MFKKAALDVLTSFFNVATLPLLDNEDASSNDMIYSSPSTSTSSSLVKSSSSQSPGGIEQLHFFHEMYQFYGAFWLSLLEQEPPLTNKDYSRTENLMWTFAFGNTMLWCHSA